MEGCDSKMFARVYQNGFDGLWQNFVDSPGKSALFELIKI